MSYLSIALLQTFQASLDGQAVAFRSRRTQALLAFLAADPRRAHTRAALAGMLWPDQPQAEALHNLSQTLLYLRQALGGRQESAPFLRVARQTIQFDPASSHAIDVVALAQALDAARSASHNAPGHTGCAICVRALEQAAELYRGPFLADLALPDSDLFDEWVLITRERIQRQVAEALERLSGFYEQREDHDRAERFTRRLLEIEPLREPAHRALMRLLARSGRRDAALAQYAICRRLLAAELDAPPAPETTALYEAIRQNHDLDASGAQRLERSFTTPPRSAGGSQRLSWNDAPAPGNVYGRHAELATLTGWLEDEECRVIALLGMGGIGKTTLAAKLAEQVAGAFDGVIWRSLLNAPPPDETLRGWLQALITPAPAALPASLDEQIDLLLAALRERRYLLVLDNLESVLQDGERAGVYRAGYADYGLLIRRLGESRHCGCLLLTSREQPHELSRLAARTLTLSGLGAGAGQAILRERGLDDAPAMHRVLVDRYSGNPLALRLVADVICELFGGSIAAFLRDEGPIFGDVRDVLDQQLARLAPLERELLTWLAVEREPATVETLHADLAGRESRRAVLEAAQSLRRRSLLEPREIGLALQNVVLEWLTDRLVAAAVNELEAGALDLLNRHALIKPQAKEYVRQSQERLIAAPVVGRLAARLGRDGCIAALRTALERMPRTRAPGYAAGNLLNLLALLRADLHGCDCARLAVWNADLRGVNLPAVSFAGADLRGTVFTDAFRAVTAVAFSPDGRLLAAGASDGSVRLWRRDGQLVHICAGHEGLVWSMAFRPDGATLASAAMDGAVRLWDVGSGELLRTLGDTGAGVRSAVFSPDGTTVAAAGFDSTVRLWDARTGELLRTLAGHPGATLGLAYSPDGAVLASSGLDGAVRLWDARTGEPIQTFHCHSDGVVQVAYSPDGALLATAGYDRTVRLWDARSGEIIHTLHGHADVVAAIAFSPDGATLASASWDQRVFLWDVRAGTLAAALHGHTSHVAAVAFTHDGSALASSDYDQSVCVWDTQTRQVVMTLRGHSAWVWALSWSPDGATLASAHHHGAVCLWDAQAAAVRMTLRGAVGEVAAVAFSPDGRQIASAGRDQVVRLWDATSGQRLGELHGHSAGVFALCYSPDSALLASASFDQTVRIWDLRDGDSVALPHTQQHTALPLAWSPDGALLALPAGNSIRLWDVRAGQTAAVLEGHTQMVLRVAFSPDGAALASCAQDDTLLMWDMRSGVPRQFAHGHGGWLFALAWSPDGATLASGGADGTIQLWDVRSAAPRLTLHDHSGWIFALAWSPDGATLASGSQNGTIRLWDAQSGACVHTLTPPGPYAGMKIAGATGLTAAQRAALTALGAVATPRDGASSVNGAVM